MGGGGKGKRELQLGVPQALVPRMADVSVLVSRSVCVCVKVMQYCGLLFVSLI